MHLRQNPLMVNREILRSQRKTWENPAPVTSYPSDCDVCKLDPDSSLILWPAHHCHSSTRSDRKVLLLWNTTTPCGHHIGPKLL